MSTALVFSFLFAQYTGMGKDLYENSPAAKAVFDMAESIRPGTIKQCFEGTKEELAVTINTQPCVTCAKMLINAGIVEIVYSNPYPEKLGSQMLAETDVKLRVYQPEKKQ